VLRVTYSKILVTQPDVWEKITLAIEMNLCQQSMALMNFSETYIINAEEEPELPDYPKDPAYQKQFGVRLPYIFGVNESRVIPYIAP